MAHVCEAGAAELLRPASASASGRPRRLSAVQPLEQRFQQATRRSSGSPRRRRARAARAPGLVTARARTSWRRSSAPSATASATRRPSLPACPTAWLDRRIVTCALAGWRDPGGRPIPMSPTPRTSTRRPCRGLVVTVGIERGGSTGMAMHSPGATRRDNSGAAPATVTWPWYLDPAGLSSLQSRGGYNRTCLVGTRHAPHVAGFSAPAPYSIVLILTIT